MCEELASDYAAYMKVDVRSELRVVEDTVDDMLTRLDEFENLLNLVRGSSAVCLDGALPKVTAWKPPLEELFGRVDRLEELVARVEADVGRVEDAVVQAETDLSGQATGKLSTFLKPLFFKNSTETSIKKSVRQTPTCDVETLLSAEEVFSGEDLRTDPASRP